jgi:hypothetical protein
MASLSTEAFTKVVKQLSRDGFTGERDFLVDGKRARLCILPAVPTVSGVEERTISVRVLEDDDGPTDKDATAPAISGITPIPDVHQRKASATVKQPK